MNTKEMTVEQMQEIVKTFSDFTNNMSHDYDGKLSDAFVETFFQQHRYLQGEMLKFIYTLLGKIGKRADEPRWIDARNEFWIRWAKNANKCNGL